MKRTVSVKKAAAKRALATMNRELVGTYTAIAAMLTEAGTGSARS